MSIYLPVCIVEAFPVVDLLGDNMKWVVKPDVAFIIAREGDDWTVVWYKGDNLTYLCKGWSHKYEFLESILFLL